MIQRCSPPPPYAQFSSILYGLCLVEQQVAKICGGWNVTISRPPRFVCDWVKPPHLAYTILNICEWVCVWRGLKCYNGNVNHTNHKYTHTDDDHITQIITGVCWCSINLYPCQTHNPLVGITSGICRAATVPHLLLITVVCRGVFFKYVDTDLKGGRNVERARDPKNSTVCNISVMCGFVYMSLWNTFDKCEINDTLTASDRIDD